MSDRILEWIVKGTLYLLVAFSIATWTTVVLKVLQVSRSRRRNLTFTDRFKPTRELPPEHEAALFDGPAARVTASAFRGLHEVERLADVTTDSDERRIYLERVLHEQTQHEKRAFESGLAILASIGTTAPFVGLFGTVWGIIHALKRIGASGSASLEVVAGPIGEALVATGIGIAVAVPAVLAYNIFVRKGKAQNADLEQLASSLIRVSAKRWSAAPAGGSGHPREAV